MKQYKLSILIPARNEMFLKKTVEDILKNKEAETEIIIGLDGEWSNPPIIQHPDVNIIYVPESVGQRGMTNLCAKLSRAKYVMKMDSHCSFDKGFDRKMIEGMRDNWTMVPTMRNLWAYSWKCYKCGWKKYQGPTPEKCPDCGRTHRIHRKMMWVGKERPQSNSYCFDPEPHFQYFREYNKRPEIRKQVKETQLSETMSLQGSCFICTRDKYWELKLSDEEFGSWGNQGVEVAVKTWLSGGKVMVNHKTWYAHMFRTQGGDFSFPYPQSGRGVQQTKRMVKDQLWNKWDKAIHPLSWLIERFMPIPGWTDEQLKQLKESEKTTWNFKKDTK